MFFADSETEAGELYNGGNGRNDEDEESSVPEDDVENKDGEEDDIQGGVGGVENLPPHVAAQVIHLL